MGVKAVSSDAMQPVSRSILSDIAVTLISAYGEPEFVKLLDAVVKRVGKQNAAPILLAFQSGIGKVIKKNKIK